jgi:hypothetical protein
VRNAAQLARQRYSAGLIDFQSVLDSERSVLVLEESFASARANACRHSSVCGAGRRLSPQAEASVYKDAP